MARGQISDEELSSGLKGLSGFGALGGTKVVKDSPFRDSRAEPKIVEVHQTPERHAVAKPPAVDVERPTVADVKPAAAKVAPRSVTTKRFAAEPKAEGQGRRVADIYTERVTLQLSPEMRDRVDALGKELQRSRTKKGERITANSVMRVAITALLDSFQPGQDDAVNSEEELLSLAKRKMLRR